jgi:hypothetical protein
MRARRLCRSPSAARLPRGRQPAALSLWLSRRSPLQLGVLYVLYWRTLRDKLDVDVVCRMFAAGFLPGGAVPVARCVSLSLLKCCGTPVFLSAASRATTSCS